jgi:hypothetical protein
MPRMNRRSLVILSFALIVPLAATAAQSIGESPFDRTGQVGRHFVLVPQHPLSDAERADLATLGCDVQRPLSHGRYLVRLSAGSTLSADDPRVRSLEAIGGSRKLQTSAYRAAAPGKTYAHLRILFNDDVTFEQARAAVTAAGGALDDALAVDFDPARALTARIPSVALMSFSDDERVFSIYGARMPPARVTNALAAALSHVTDVQAAPFNLTGDGVALSYFEPGLADVTHKEFGGRLTAHFTCSPNDSSCNDQGNQQHATHTAGTMIAAGDFLPRAKGMAPKATLHGFQVVNANTSFFTRKQSGISDVNSVADSNSWGFTWGFTQEGSTGWAWNDGDELIGGYDGTLSAVTDHIARTNTTLFMYAAGNEADITGPTFAPFPHNHTDDNFNPTKDVYCYSQDGSGRDCPTPACSAGTQFCEITPHPTHHPFGSIGWAASEKNIIAVGATDQSQTVASFSDRGPARDGRVKPEITAKGVQLE